LSINENVQSDINGVINENEYIIDINFENNEFINNKAENFGGAIYSTYNKLFTNGVNNFITENIAGIMGGGIYTPNMKNQTISNIKNFIFNYNTVESQKNDISSKPYYILLDTKITNNKIEMKSGEIISLKFLLLDGYKEIITDVTKYYSLLTLKLLLEDKYDNDIKSSVNDDDKKLNYFMKDYTGTFVDGNE